MITKEPIFFSPLPRILGGYQDPIGGQKTRGKGKKKGKGKKGEEKF